MASPNWGPLEAAVPPDQMGEWMWMGMVKHDGRTIEQYKHRDSRRYVNIDQDGKAWRLRFTGSDTPSAEQVPLAEAIAEARR